MAEVVIGALLNVTKEILQKQIRLVIFFKNDLENLKKSLLMVHDFLYDAEMQPVTNTAVKRWLRNLEDVAFDADNVLDEINYQILSRNVDDISSQLLSNKVEEIIYQFLSRVHSFCSLSQNPIEIRRRLAIRIRDINKKLKTINQEATTFELQTLMHIAPVSGSDASTILSRETDSLSVDPLILGRENDVSRIVEMLIVASTSPAEHQVFSILPIVGMGGLGKTTLARKVFGDEHIKSHFGDNRVWVYVPRIFDVVLLLKNILTTLTAENVLEHGTREAFLKKLQKHLSAKRYLFVLDDVWNEDREMWDNFVNSLAGISSALGNCIIVTTRSHEVAKIVRTLPVHKLESLSKEDCWSIIKAKAFNNLRDIPTEFEKMGRNIAKRCQGLPLAAKVVGGLLRDKSEDEWLSIENKWLLDYGDGNTISKILKVSFDNLSPPSLKKCFAYCSIFPKGHEIGKKQLVELWMAEGFLQRSDDMETIGNKFVYLLLQNSLLQVVKRDNYGNATHCNMHDLVHDLACSILCENDNVTDEICRSRYTGYRWSGNIESCSIPEEQERCVRTLFFNVKISEIMFSNFKSLRTLTLVGYDIDELPTSIRELIHLRYLDTSYTTIRYFPDSLGELYHLQTLRACERGWSYLEKLPDSLKYLISLRHLYIPNNIELPPEIGRLTSLQTLPYFYVGHEMGRRIVELGKLKNLKGELEIYNLEKVFDKNEAMSADLIGKSNISKLKFDWSGSGANVKSVWESKLNCDWSGSGGNEKSVLEGLQPHPNLKSLEICGFKGDSLPSWTLKMAVQDGCWEGLLNNLTKIILRNCSECEELPMLGHLPHLKSLNLSNMRNVRSIGSSFYNLDKCRKSRSSNRQRESMIIVFRALERLELSGMPNLREWAKVELAPNEVVVFPCLEYLKVRGCTQLKIAPSHFPYLKELEIGRMENFYCFTNDLESVVPLEKILVNSTTLTKLKICGIGLECLPNGLFSKNHNILELEIDDCLNLRELPDDLHSLNSLETLRIRDCPNLKSIPYPTSSGHDHQSQAGFTSLRQLDIIGCKGLTSLPIEMVESCAPSLEWLSLNGLSSSITNLGMVIGCLHKMPRLTSLVICNVPKFSINLEIDSLRLSSSSSSLRELSIGHFSDSSWNNVSFNETVDAILQLSQFSLRRLELYGMEHWDYYCLPNQLQHLNALSILYLYDFGIEALPEWFGNLSSLEELHLFHCNKLRNLPSIKAMQRLVNLTDLYISDCPQLLSKKGSRSNNNNDQWHKISHIKYLSVGI